jgi:hypothetical protein
VSLTMHTAPAPSPGGRLVPRGPFNCTYVDSFNTGVAGSPATALYSKKGTCKAGTKACICCGVWSHPCGKQ